MQRGGGESIGIRLDASPNLLTENDAKAPPSKGWRAGLISGCLTDVLRKRQAQGRELLRDLIRMDGAGIVINGDVADLFIHTYGCDARQRIQELLDFLGVVLSHAVQGLKICAL